MKLTKYEHACFTLEKDGKLLIVDPGGWTTDLIAPEHVEAIVITHKHADHLDQQKLQDIVAQNPNVTIYTHESIVAELDTLPTQSVSAGQTIAAPTFSLEFFGGEHAIIHSSLPRVANLGVMIEDLIYYPGDSFALPNKPVKILALPVSAPWLKISEAMDFVSQVKAEFVFPTHDAILSSDGKALVDRLISGVVENYSGTYERLLGPKEL